MKYLKGTVGLLVTILILGAGMAAFGFLGFGGTSGNDVLYGSLQDNPEDEARDLLAGGAGNDYIIGSMGSDTIDGGDDDDILSGKEGIDYIDGGLGNDVLLGGGADDYFRRQAV